MTDFSPPPVGGADATPRYPLGVAEMARRVQAASLFNDPLATAWREWSAGLHQQLPFPERIRLAALEVAVREHPDEPYGQQVVIAKKYARFIAEGAV